MTRAELIIVLTHAIFSLAGLTIIAFQLAAVSRMSVQIAELIARTH